MRFGEGKAELGEERTDEVIVPFARLAASVGEKLLTPGADGELEVEELIERKALAGEFAVREFDGEVEGPDGDGAGEGEHGVRAGGFQPPLRSVRCVRTAAGSRRHESWVPFGNLSAVFLQRPPHQPAQPALREALRQRIHRHDAVQVNRRLVARFDDFGLGVINRARLERE